MKNAIDKVGCSTLSKAALTAVILASMTMGANAADTTYQLDEVVVTATKTENTIKDVPEATEVITQEDFKRLGAQDLNSALRLAENVNVAPANMIGNNTGIRGMDNAHTLVLVNGMRMAAEDTTETANVYELSRINLSNVDRVEIVRGTSSALYGSDALGGVINIITKKPAEAGLTVGANTGTLQSNNYYHYDLGQQGKFNGSFDVNFQKLRKYSYNDTKATTLFGPRQNFNFDGEYTLSEGRTIGLNVGYMKDKLRNNYVDMDYQRQGTVFPIARDQYQNTDSTRKSVALDYHMKTDASDFMVRAYYNRLDKENNTFNKVQNFQPLDHYVRSDWDTSKFNTFVLETRGSTRISEAHRITAGGEYRHFSYEGTRLGADGGNQPVANKHARNEKIAYTAAYFQDEWTPTDKLLVIPSVRYDHSDRFGSNVSPKVGLTYKFDDHFRFKANYGRGFRAPTISELYMDWDSGPMMGMFPGFAHFYGNPDLKPEKSLGYDFGVEGEFGKSFAKVTYFNTDISNLIAWGPAGNGIGQAMNQQYKNIGRAKLEGVETAVGYHFNDNWTVKGTWNYLDATDESDGSSLDYRAKYYGTIQLLYNDETNGLSGVLWYQYTNRYQETDRDTNGKILAYRFYNYSTLNLALNKRWNEHLSTFVGIDNMLNQRHDAISFGGRFWRTGVEWKF